MGPLEFMSWSPSSKIYTSPGRLGGSCRRQLKTTATAPHNTRCHLPYTSYLLYRTRAAYDITNSTVQHSTAQYSTARHGTAQHSTAQHITAHSQAQHSTQPSTAQSGTAQTPTSVAPTRTAHSNMPQGAHAQPSAPMSSPLQLCACLPRGRDAQQAYRGFRGRGLL